MKITVGENGVLPKINKIFSKLFSDKLSDKRYWQIFGGRGSGKSFTVSIYIVLLTFSDFVHHILYLRQAMSSSACMLLNLPNPNNFTGYPGPCPVPEGRVTSAGPVLWC